MRQEASSEQRLPVPMGLLIYIALCAAIWWLFHNQRSMPC